MIEPDDAMLDALRKSDISAFSEAVNKNKTFIPLLNNALDCAAQGITSIDEVMRLAGEVYENETHNVRQYNLNELAQS